MKFIFIVLYTSNCPVKLIRNNKQYNLGVINKILESKIFKIEYAEISDKLWHIEPFKENILIPYCIDLKFWDIHKFNFLYAG